MPIRVAAYGNTPVSVGDNQRTALEFTQNLALTKSTQGDSKAFFVADLGKIQTLVTQWEVLLPRVRPYYSINCNSNDILLRIISSMPQIGLHCITRQNLDTAIEHVRSERVFYTNPCWTKQTLRHANQNGVELLSFDSENDLSRMATAGIKAGLILNVALNNLSNDPATMLGCGVENAAKLLSTAADLGLNCVGVGFNLGMSVYRGTLYEEAIQIAAGLFMVGRSLGLPMRILNLGDGFTSTLNTNSDSFESICYHINAALDYYFPLNNCNVEIIATPGRYFAASIFSLVTKIVKKLECDASAITNDDFDAGQKGFVYHIDEGFYGPFGCRTMTNCDPKCVPLFVKSKNVDETMEKEKKDVEKEEEEDIFYGSVMGPNIDDEFNTVQKQCRFRNLSVGEWLFWENLGAYSMDNCDTMDDDNIETPSVFYYAKEIDWKLINPNVVDNTENHESATYMDLDQLYSDGDSAIDSECEDTLWLFELHDE